MCRSFPSLFTSLPRRSAAPGTNKLHSLPPSPAAFCFSTENFTSILFSTLTLIADFADGRTDGRTEYDAAAVLLMNNGGGGGGSSGGACVERRRRVNEIIQEREKRERRERERERERGRADARRTNRSVWVYAACVVDMDTIIIACGAEWSGVEWLDGWTDTTTNHRERERGSLFVVLTERPPQHRTRGVKLSQSQREPFLVPFLSWGQNYSAFVKHLRSKKKRLPSLLLSAPLPP